MTEIDPKLLTESISKNLFNPNFDHSTQEKKEVNFSNRNFMFEQYRLLVDSSHKIEERRGGSNSIFIGINTILVSVLVHPDQLTKIETSGLTPLPFLVLIGILISLNWLKVIASYKTLNSVNYHLIQAFEALFPTYVFSLRGKIEAEQTDQPKSKRANIVLMNENLLPKAFLLIYFIYLVTTIVTFVTKFYYN